MRGSRLVRLALIPSGNGQPASVSTPCRSSACGPSLGWPAVASAPIPRRLHAGGHLPGAVGEGRPEQSRPSARSTRSAYDHGPRWSADRGKWRRCLVGWLHLLTKAGRRGQQQRRQRKPTPLQHRDAGHGDTPWREARDEQLRCVSRYASMRDDGCCLDAKICSNVS